MNRYITWGAGKLSKQTNKQKKWSSVVLDLISSSITRCAVAFEFVVISGKPRRAAVGCRNKGVKARDSEGLMGIEMAS